MTISEALDCAFMVHDGQVDKGGEPYIKHVLRVAMTVHKVSYAEGGSNGIWKEDYIVCALLHDVFEDATNEDLVRRTYQKLTTHQADALRRLTRRKDRSYFDYIAALIGNPIAMEVKKADLRDNLNEERLKRELDDTDRARMDKYRFALAMLQEKV